MRDIERNPGDTLWLTAFSLPTLGSNFTLLRGSRAQRTSTKHLEWMAAFDFQCVNLMMGPVWRSFMDYGAQEFSENSFTRRNEVPLSTSSEPR